VRSRLHLAPLLVAAAVLLAAGSAFAQDSSTAARQEVRIQELEGQIRQLNGQIEELSFRNQQLTNRVDKLIADMDFRLRELEGGGGAAMEGDAGPADTQTGVAPSDSAESADAAPEQPAAGGTRSSTVGQPQVLGTLSQGELDAQSKQLNRSADPAAAAAAAAGAAGTSASEEGQVAATQPYALPGATPDEQYQYAFDLLRQNKYGDAEQALGTFVEQNPDHPLAGNANYWLGETYYVRQDYQNAAITFADGSQKYPKSGKAPDSLLKLGMSLAALGETADACLALAELTERYPNASGSVKQRAAKEQAKNGCQ